MEFAYNNNFQANIGMTPFEALYGRRCRSPVCWDDVGKKKLLGPELVQLTVKKEYPRLVQEKPSVRYPAIQTIPTFFITQLKTQTNIARRFQSSDHNQTRHIWALLPVAIKCGCFFMEGGDNILEAIYEEDDLEDVEMLDIEGEHVDVEEGECVDVEGEFMKENSQSSGQIVNTVNQDACSKNRRRRQNKRKNKRKKSGSVPKVTDINRFVLDTCKRLKEKKSYLVWTAVGCLGVSALSDLVKEVDAIQACGGQMTADGKRSRTGGGILWSIIKVRDPNAYKEIMKRGKEFEKQFRQPNSKQPPAQNKEASSQNIVHTSIDDTAINVSDGSQLTPPVQDQLEQPNAGGNRVSVHNRMRVPVTYDDLLVENPKDD
ncbi:hypothetical protein VitviT2T_004398 [Vitis vinifera]|uniref:Phosphorylated adapter RNA export protein n=2 Tax=Vitis vinifera TaxID=29760 RepID=A0ABY9BQ37_VITVI|nr:hypothetical protein VitviT2T_004398 [Vitis vinifera]